MTPDNSEVSVVETDAQVKNATIRVTQERVKIGEAIVGPGDKHFTHTQSVASDTWTVRHGLNKKPAVTVVDSAGTEWTTEIEYLDLDRCVLHFASAFAGEAYFN